MSAILLLRKLCSMRTLPRRNRDGGGGLVLQKAASEFWAAEDKAAEALSQLIGTPGFASEITADRRTRA